jgi:signal transduction histidine kinase
MSVPAIVRAPIERVTWAEVLYAVVSLPLAVAGFAFVMITSVVGTALSVTFIGLPVLALGGLGARWLGAMQRRLARALLDERVAAPPAFVAPPGALAWLQAALRDGPGWRSRGYLLVKLPLAALTGMVIVGWVTSPYALVSQMLAGRFGVALTSVLVVLAGPWVLRGLVWVDRHLVRALLGLDADAARVLELEQARAGIVDDAAATLRRIERDLHDGTQAQLGTLAMKLGQAKEKLERRDDVPYDPAGALALIESTHRDAKDALVELRNIVRGIHPPALDLGLDAALETLAARSPVPTTLRVDLPRRPSAAIENIAYFSAAELVANALKHGRATRIDIELGQHRGGLRLRVADDGVGGATQGAGTGLTGLAVRAQAVDGRVEIASPPGGPTVITVDLPLYV